MPVKRRRPKVRAEDLRAWEMVFLSGYDFFHELPAIGVETDAYSRPGRDEAEAAWQRLGSVYLEGYRDERTPWALEEFGDPRPRNFRRL